MKFVLAAAALAGVAFAAPQGVTADITPTAAAPAGCTPSYAGEFEITVVKPAAKRDVSSCGQTGILTLTLAGGQLHDAKGRTGYIAANRQFQFDGPPQTGAIYTGGFSICGNGTIALGGSTIFYECLSGGFYNLYDENNAAQCSPVEIQIIPCSGAPAGSATPVTTQAATQSSDGQVEASSAVPVSQISDAQPQAASATPAPISEYSDGQPQMPTAPPVSEFSDGQPQVTSTAAPVSQISDGQPQAGNATATASIVAAGASAIGMSVQLVAAVAGVAAFAIL